MEPTRWLYFVILGLVRTVKWIELQVLKLFSKRINNIGPKIIAKKLGIIAHFTDESYRNWGPGEEKKALEKCKGRYESLVHMRVYDPMAALHAINTGGWGMGEGYVNQLWGLCEGRDERDFTELSKRFLERNGLALYYNWWNRFWHYLEFDLFNLQTRTWSLQAGVKHYDIGNDIFETTMMDPWMQYSCAYWANASNLNDAQVAKLELIAKKLQLKPGMRLLDIGCGWGKTCKYFAEKYGVECVGVTISKEQVEYGRRMCKGLPVEIRFQDYRDVNESFDRIVSVEMFGHVGPKNHNDYFKVAHKNLKEDGLFLLHSFGTNHMDMPRCDRWINSRIFQVGAVSSPCDITKATEPYFVIEDWHNFGHDYSLTLNAWRDNFKKGWPALEAKYGEEFYRVWTAYLSFSEALFSSRKLHVWQIVFSKDGVKGGYRSVR